MCNVCAYVLGYQSSYSYTQDFKYVQCNCICTGLPYTVQLCVGRYIYLRYVYMYNVQGVETTCSYLYVVRLMYVYV